MLSFSFMPCVDSKLLPNAKPEEDMCTGVVTHCAFNVISCQNNFTAWLLLKSWEISLKWAIAKTVRDRARPSRYHLGGKSLQNAMIFNWKSWNDPFEIDKWLMIINHQKMGKQEFEMDISVVALLGHPLGHPVREWQCVEWDEGVQSRHQIREHYRGKIPAIGSSEMRLWPIWNGHRSSSSDAGCPSEGMERDDGVRSRRQSRPSHEVEDGDEVGQHQLPKCSQAEHS